MDGIRIHQLAKSLDLGLSSTDLIAICQEAGMNGIKHHFQKLTSQEADMIRKTARQYKQKMSASRQNERFSEYFPKISGTNDAFIDLESILDLNHLQRMMKDFYELSGIPVSLIDTEGNVLAGIGWQRICTEFHRKHYETRKNCIESDTKLSMGVPVEDFNLYRCKNGLWDAATPVVIEGETVGNVFTGQFFLEVEEIDREYFLKQAKRCGFNKKEYLKALDQVPVFNRDTVNASMKFFSKLANLLSRQGFAESKRRRSEKRYRGILESQNDLIVRVDTQNRFTYVNDTYCRTFGKTREELIGRQFIPLVHEDDREATLKAMEALKKSPFRASLEQRAMTVDGWRWIYWEDNAIFGNDGEIVEIQGVGRDITEIKETQQKLRVKHDQLNGVLNSVPDILGIQKPDHTIIKYNRAGYDMLGMSEEDVCGMKCYELIGRRSECEECATSKALKTKKLETVEKYVPELDRYLNCRSNPVLDEKGNIIYIVEQLRDVTERKQAEEAIRRERDYMFLIFDSMEQYVFVDSPDYRIEYMNSKAKDDFGELVGEICYQQLGRSNPCPVCPIPKLLQNGSEETIHFQVEAFDRILEGSATRITNLDGSVSVLEVMSDMTDRVRQEREIRHMSLHDMLTDLYNRNFATEEFKRLDTERQLPLSIIMGDVNSLKLVNDTFGHSEGDRLLQETAKVLRRACRNEDIVSRWGGDEFVILLPQTERNVAEKICERIMNHAKNIRVHQLPLSIALGSATKEQSHQNRVDIMKEAEKRMYQNKLSQAQEVHSNLIKTMIKVLGIKSHESERHCWRMQKMARELGEGVGLQPHELDRLALAASLHDIGKLGIADEIITKKGALTSEEWEKIKQHPERGHGIASASEEFAHVAYPILHHHERWDGTGYPKGLSKDNIPLLSRIIAVVDAYDAMRDNRSYSASISREKALEELKKHAGSYFDPKLVDIFTRLAEEGKITPWEPET